MFSNFWKGTYLVQDNKKVDFSNLNLKSYHCQEQKKTWERKNLICAPLHVSVTKKYLDLDCFPTTWHSTDYVPFPYGKRLFIGLYTLT